MEEYQQRWNDCLKIIADNVGQERFDNLFKCARAVSFQDNELVLRVPSAFFAEIYEEKFYEILRASMHKCFGAGVKLSYVYPVVDGDESTNVTLHTPEQSRVIANKTLISERLGGGIRTAQSDIDPQLNPAYNFENYCVGKSNHLPFVVAEYIANHPDKSDFNPFFLYGSVGVGKTHLIQAIGIRLKEKTPSLRVLYMPYRQFEHDYTQHTISKTVPDFIEKYEQIDVLLIDDLQEISGKTGTMKVLFPIFNHLHQRGRKLIFTSDRPPGDLDGVTDRLIDRFKWGVVEQLPKPDLELRKEILDFKARRNGLDLPEDVIEVIATHADSSVREIEGVVMGIITRSIALNLPINKELAMEVLSHTVRADKHPAINFDMIVEATAEYYRLNPDVIFTKSRVRDIADARQLIMYLCSKHTGLSSSAIGAKLNRRHATVLHAVKAISDRMPYSKELTSAVDTIESRLKS